MFPLITLYPQLVVISGCIYSIYIDFLFNLLRGTYFHITSILYLEKSPQDIVFCIPNVTFYLYLQLKITKITL